MIFRALSQVRQSNHRSLLLLRNLTQSKILNPSFIKWRKIDRLVKGWLTATLSKEVLGIVVGLDTAVEVKNALVHTFACVSLDQSLALKQRLTSMNRGTGILVEYLHRFKAVCDNLATIGKPCYHRLFVTTLQRTCFFSRTFI